MTVYAALFFVAFPIGIPLVWFIKLRELKPYIIRAATPEVTEGEVGNVIRNQRGQVLRPGNVNVEDDAVLSTSPFQVLFSGIRAPLAVSHEVLDMARRLALTCVTMMFELNGLILTSLCVGLLALAGHYDGRPYDNLLMNNVVAVAHWQTLLVIIVLLLRDAEMFQSFSIELMGGALVVTNSLLLVRLFRPISPAIHQAARNVIQGTCVFVRGGESGDSEPADCGVASPNQLAIEMSPSSRDSTVRTQKEKGEESTY